MGTENRRDASPSQASGTSRKLIQKRARRLDRDAASKKGRDWTRIVYAAIFVALGLGGLVVLIYANSWPAPKGIQPAVGSAQQVGERVLVEQGIHISPPQRTHYATDPPTSGQHYSLRGTAPAAWGFYDHALDPEVWIHNLEHGGVVILYNCSPATSSPGTNPAQGASSSCADDQRKISDFVSAAPQDALFQKVKIVATEYPVPGHPFAIVAWGWRVFMDSWDDAEAERFYEAHVDNGPEKMP